MSIWNWIYALFPFALFCFIAITFTNRRFSAKTTYIVWSAVCVAVVIPHVVVFAADKGATLLLSLMPVTAYLPLAVTFFVLSKRNIVSNILTILIAALGAVSLSLANAFIQRIWASEMENAAHWGTVATVLAFVVSVCGGGAFGFAAYRLLHKIFKRETVLENKNWYVLPAVFLLLLLSLYQNAMTKSPLLIMFLLLMDVCVLAVITAFIVSRYKSIQTETERAAMETQLAAEREEYGALKTSLETDRRYRHDIKHHFNAILALASEGDNDKISEYVTTLGAQLTETEHKVYCVNNVLNAVLSSFCERAKAHGAETKIDAVVPEKPPVDEYELCALLCNALDNALNACDKLADGEKKITLSVKCDEFGKTVVKVVNTVSGKVELSKNGLPVFNRTEEHGWGLSSIKCITEKYGGLLKCVSEENTFTLITVLFGKSAATPKSSGGKTAVLRSFAAFFIIVFGAVLTVNFMPATVNALEQIPYVGQVVKIVDFRTWGLSWGDSKINIQQPTTNNPYADEYIAALVKDCKLEFERYFASKYNGYVAAEFTYEEIVNDENIYVVRMSCLLQAGSSAEYNRYFVVNKTDGKIAEMEDLFRPNSDWNAVISAEIRRQMAELTERGEGDFYGFGNWVNEPSEFVRLSEPNFYINKLHQLVIVFDEQQVAPGNMGSPEFTVPYNVIYGLLRENSLLKENILI